MHSVTVFAVKIVADRDLRLESAQHFNLKAQRVVLSITLGRNRFKCALNRLGIIIGEVAYNRIIFYTHCPKSV